MNPTGDTAANAVLAILSSVPAYWFALESGTSYGYAKALILPVTFFVVGKGVDVLVKIYLERRK